jgi:hypothetical protein
VLLRRETTRDRSYQGPSITSRLLRRTLPTKALGTQRTDSYQGFVRFASITQINTQTRRTLPTKALGTQRTSSYQGFVRFASITQINTQYDLFTEPVHPAASAAPSTYLQPRHRLLPCRSATSKITSITRPNASVPFSLLRPLQAINTITYTTIYASYYVRYRNLTSALG